MKANVALIEEERLGVLDRPKINNFPTIYFSDSPLKKMCCIPTVYLSKCLAAIGT